MNQNGHPVNVADVDPASAARDFDRARQAGSRRNRASTARPDGAAEPAEKPAISIDAWSLLRPASHRWYWLLFGGALGAVLGTFLALALWHTTYSATAQIIRFDPPVATEAFRPLKLNGPTLMDMLNSLEVFRGVGKRMKPPMSPGEAKARINPVPGRESEVVTIQTTGRDLQNSIDLANAYSAEAIELTREHQRQEAREAEALTTAQLEETTKELEQARKELPDVIPAGVNLAGTGADGAASPMAPDAALQQIQTAKAELATLLVKFTDAYPLVKQKRAEIAALEAQVPAPIAKAQAEAIANHKPLSTAAAPSSTSAYELAFYNVRTLDNLRVQLTQRQHAIRTFIENPPGNFRPLQPASLDTAAMHKPLFKIILVAAFFGMLGIVATGGELLRRELFDTRLKTEADVRRVTGLPVIGSLGDLRGMTATAREAWAFRTWIALQDRLAYSPNHGLICGVTSSNSGDGRTTWVNLLAAAARKCGFRVLTIATRPTADVPGAADDVETVTAAEAAAAPGTNGAHAHANGSHTVNGANGATNGVVYGPTPATNGRSTALMSNPNDFAASSRAFSGESEFTALTASALFTPAMVTEKLMGSETDPLVHIPLPGWTWNLERRKQWQGALNVWRKIDNVVILVELPPASMAESVLLASNLPNLLWLVEAGKSEATETRAQLETLRHARCNLVGSVINRAMGAVARGKLARWVGCLLPFVFALGLLGQRAVAADAQSSPEATPAPEMASFSVVSPTQRAAWQQKLTLGPGDVLTIGMFGDPESTREEVPIGPDGRISYLEADNIMAAGLTVDEFRERLNQELGKYRRAPQAYVVPVAYKSKKYYMLGKVTQRGAFPLNRPMTLIEAVAQARGMETGLAADRSLVELADLSRSFVVRDGRKLPVDFEKLFEQGDLSQNVALEPNDYIYFPAADQKEVFVLGAVSYPGAQSYTTTIGAVGAIAARGGFTLRAWQKKLLVLRGSMGHPQTFVVDAGDVLAGRTPDLKLEPKDIIFVSERPWIRAEDLLDEAASAFVTAAVVSWTGLHVDPISNPTR